MHLSKKAVSMMVSYALLVVIGIAISAIAYPYLKNLVTPPQFGECPPDMSLSIEELSCNRADWSVSVKLLNRGLFNVTGAYLRFGYENWTVRPQINKDKEIYLKGGVAGVDNSPLAPGQSTTLNTYQAGDMSTLPANSTFILEVQPAVYKDGVLVPCAGKIITQEITCISTQIGFLFDDTGDEYAFIGGTFDGYPPENINDTSWTTRTTAASNTEFIYYVNYTKRSNYESGSKWRVVWGNSTGGEQVELVVPADCWNQNEGNLQFRVRIDLTPPTPEYRKTYLECYDGNTPWDGLGSLNHDPGTKVWVYEEGMNWKRRS